MRGKRSRDQMKTKQNKQNEMKNEMLSKEEMT